MLRRHIWLTLLGAAFSREHKLMPILMEKNLELADDQFKLPADDAPLVASIWWSGSPRGLALRVR
jgi:hypothetical protein